MTLKELKPFIRAARITLDTPTGLIHRFDWSVKKHDDLAVQYVEPYVDYRGMSALYIKVYQGETEND